MGGIDENVRETAKAVVEILSGGRYMIGTSESVTGGAIAAALARVDGCSAVLFASQVTYSLPGKVAFLGVSPDEIERYGTVSPFVIEAMHASMVAKFSSVLVEGFPGWSSPPSGFVSVGVTGVAGAPIEDKPRGHVLLGINTYKVAGEALLLKSSQVETHVFSGDRKSIISRAVHATLARVLHLS